MQSIMGSGEAGGFLLPAPAYPSNGKAPNQEGVIAHSADLPVKYGLIMLCRIDERACVCA